MSGLTSTKTICAPLSTNAFAVDTKVYDDIIPVSNEDAFKFGKIVGRKEGFLVGISAGAALSAAVTIAKKPENKGKNIVVIFPDTGDRYLSTPLFAD